MVHSSPLESSGDGAPIRCLRSIFVPEEETWFLLFEAPTNAAFRHAVRRGGVQVRTDPVKAFGETRGNLELLSREAERYRAVVERSAPRGADRLGDRSSAVGPGLEPNATLLQSIERRF